MQTKMFEIPQPNSLPRWQDTKITETPGSRATDPLKITGGDTGRWWEHSTPPILRDRLRGRNRLAGGRRSYGTDGKAEENTEVGPEGWGSKEIAELQAEDAGPFEIYFLGFDQDVYEWLHSLPTFIELNEARKPLFAELRQHIEAFPVGTKGAETDLQDVNALVAKMCELPGGLLIPFGGKQ
jgi:hypothetical protein